MTRPTPPDARAWERRRLLTVVVAGALTGAVLLAGLVYAVSRAAGLAAPLEPGGASVSSPPSGAGRPSSRDELAAAPMLPVEPAAAQPTAPAAATSPGLQVPPATRTGPAGVPTGFPRTPEGAVGQLAAIETVVLQRMSAWHTAEVYRHWALPGGVGPAEWRLAGNVRAFLAAAETAGGQGSWSTLAAVPAAAQVKVSDGPDWVVACVLLEVTARITVEARMGYGYCERMQWQRSRWLIAPGTPPAEAPSTWPGSELSVRAGWRTWVDAADR